ncbi:MAG TPA: antitoxin [Thermoanaerobaculia bacterium]|nr:antitoxin [Thermoanaerobaculia bacterium]
MTMRTTVTLDDDVYEAAQAHARATGKRLGRVLSEMARQALEPSGRRTKPSAKEVSRFPVFEVPANARVIPASRIQKALDDDGIV